MLFLSFAVESYQSAGQPRRLLWKAEWLVAGAMHNHQFSKGRIFNQKASLLLGAKVEERTYL